MNKRLNSENKEQIYLEKCLPQLYLNINEAKLSSAKTGEFLQGPAPFSKRNTVDELVEVIRSYKEEDTDSGLLTISEEYSRCIQALTVLFSKITNTPLPVDKDDNVYLCLDFEEESHREFVNSLEGIKLPAIDTLFLDNFCEGDEDVENFLSNGVSSINNFILKTEGYCVDFHDYLDKIVSIHSLQNLYLKGFLVDSEDAERLFSETNCWKIIFESWNIAVDEDFRISSDSNPSIAKNGWSILKSLHFIDNEMELENMKILVKAIKGSFIGASFSQIFMTEWSLEQEQVDALLKL